MNNESSVFLVILGAVLAIITSVIVELIKYWLTTKNSRKNVSTILRLELKNFITIVDQFVESYGSKRYFEYRLLDQMDRNLTRLESTRDNVIFLTNDNKKDELLTLFNSIALLASDARGMQNYAETKIADETPAAASTRREFTDSGRQMIIMRTTDLKRRAQDLINFLER